MVAVWNKDVQRATDILYTGPAQRCESRDAFVEMTCEIPSDVEIQGSAQEPLVLAFLSELVTDTRSAGAEMGQVLGLVAHPVIHRSVYLNGKLSTGTWRAYESTLVGKFYFTPTVPPESL